MTYSDKRSKRLGCAILLIVVAVASALLYGWFEGGPYTSTLPRTFNSKDWKVANDGARCGMLADLRYRVGVVGRTRTELYGMLGKPDDEDSNDPTLDHWHLCPSFMDVYILEVRWRDNRAVSEWVRDT
jgi:hypothetical protein